jgi:gamma-glutamyltranspeptidase/glutathione hydrolase
VKSLVFCTILSAATLTSCADLLQKSVHRISASLEFNDEIPTLLSRTKINTTGMVAAANPLAVEAGLDVLAKGGSAVDAAIAVQAMLGLVEPQSSGVSGGAFLMLYDSRDGSIWGYEGREAAPAEILADLFENEGRTLTRRDGILSGISTGVPGVMDMLYLAHKDYGQMDWGPQFDFTIQTALNGFEVSPRMADMIASYGNEGLKNQKEAREYYFLEDGITPLPVGYVRDNKPYAETLLALKANPRALLEGPIAEAIINAVRETPRPGTLNLNDMASYKARKRKPICSKYRSHTVCGPKPPSSGGIAVQAILGILENFDMKGYGQTVEGWHLFSEASFLAYADRDLYVADDTFIEVPISEMLAKDYLTSRASLISLETAMGDVKAGNPVDFIRGKDATPDNPGTTHFTIVDQNGLVISMTSTVEAGFGSQRMVNGFMLNNQLTDFSFRAFDEHGRPIANAPAAFKRPRSSMAPSLIFDEKGQFLFSTGSPGGNSIIGYTAKTIVGIIDWDLSPKEAIEIPNVIARNSEIRVETSHMDKALFKGLEKKGHTVRRSRGENSGIQIIYRNSDGTLSGAADPRREGIAKSVSE